MKEESKEWANYNQSQAINVKSEKWAIVERGAHIRV